VLIRQTPAHPIAPKARRPLPLPIHPLSPMFLGLHMSRWRGWTAALPFLTGGKKKNVAEEKMRLRIQKTAPGWVPGGDSSAEAAPLYQRQLEHELNAAGSSGWFLDRWSRSVSCAGGTERWGITALLNC